MGIQKNGCTMETMLAVGFEVHASAVTFILLLLTKSPDPLRYKSDRCRLLPEVGETHFPPLVRGCLRRHIRS